MIDGYKTSKIYKDKKYYKLETFINISNGNLSMNNEWKITWYLSTKPTDEVFINLQKKHRHLTWTKNLCEIYVTHKSHVLIFIEKKKAKFYVSPKIKNQSHLTFLLNW